MYLHFAPFIACEVMKIVQILKQGRQQSVLHNQYYGSWWPGDAGSQGINNNVIDLANIDYHVASFQLKS